MDNTPQLENGFLRIATDISKYLAMTYMSSYESQILWAIFQKTYGYHKKEDWISNSQFVELTGMHKAHVSRTLKKLIKRHIVTQTGNKIAFQKDSRLWCKLPKQVTLNKKLPKQVQLLPKQALKLPKQADTIDNTTIDTYTKDNSNKLLGMFKTINPFYERLYSNKTQRACIKRLSDKYGEDRLSNLITNLPEIMSRPYAPQITTPYELEVKMGRLIQFINQEKLKIAKTGTTKI